MVFSFYTKRRVQYDPITMKKTKKIINWLLGGISLTYAVIIIFPSFLFANNLEYKNFNVYYHSSEINVEKLKSVLDESQNLLHNTQLFNDEIDQEIFICNRFNEFTFFALFSRKAFAVNYPITQNIFLSKSSITEKARIS